MTVAADDASEWARVHRVIAQGPEVAARWNRDYLERNGMTLRVEEIARELASVGRGPRADGEDNGDG